MKLYSGKVPFIAEDLLRELTKDEDIEVESSEEVRLDFEAVLKEFIRRSRRVVDEAKDRMERAGLSYAVMGKVRAQVAKEMGFPPHDEQLPYLVEQLMTMLFHSANVAEVWAEDGVLRKKIATVLRKHTNMESDLDREVRSKIKNLEEGTAAFEVEYEKVMASLKSRKHLE
ncbi:MAG TPA: DUF507 family protein [Polyangiaceae bacterium LLY-WYZ-15_(1-7)]|nr:hypothetical protein [Myxococcales bacterium]MAT23418.1 hypothetical protein [Sandaracinus sp.]HJK90813.1 DUF507 family protein [Polyangiaceae bacterium LLY-WYZ-15_(1-7)]MBJ72590.1 hypothetical protein [Sandaracinus sp.]HJL04621.1 DUF507 family protein [Polyangiaceae bacterium LLY-WYZ-15_(1-7)]